MKGFQDSNKKNQNLRKRDISLGLNENLNLYNKALKLQNKGDFVQAANTYNILFKNNFRTEEFFLNYAIVCQYLRDTNNSILFLREAIKINPLVVGKNILNLCRNL